MAYEIRGSILVYITLIVTCTFPPFSRAAIFFFLTAYSFYWNPDVLADIPFYTGALLADLSLILAQNASSPAWSTRSTGPFARLRSHWPNILAFIGLIIASYPPDSAELAGWSQSMQNLGEIVFPTGCTSYSFIF
jgi:hypothetical protein